VLLSSASATATFITVLSGVATIGSFLAYLYFAQRSNANAARDEALALAETRREVIADLRAQLASSDESRMRLETQADRRIRKLETALKDARTEAREQAYQIQRLYATGLADVLAGFVATSRRSPRTWNERSVGSGSYLPVCRLRRRSWPPTAAG